MHERIIIAGSGGQGVLLIGKLLASVAVQRIAHVTFFPAYGAEVRGGVSNCQVILSDNEIASPVSTRFDAALILNQPSLEQYGGGVETDGLTIVNSSLCAAEASAAIVTLPASEMAVELGDQRVANVIMLGAYLAHHPVVPPADVEREIQRVLGARNAALAELNLTAFREGGAA